MSRLQEGKHDTPCVAEKFIDGEYFKFTNNMGYTIKTKVSGAGTAQAFSHFTWEASGHQELVCDIQASQRVCCDYSIRALLTLYPFCLQGNKECWTDAGIHTKDGRDYSSTNLGSRGINAFFASHKCNEHCKRLGIDKKSQKKATHVSSKDALRADCDEDDDGPYERHMEYNAFY